MRKHLYILKSSVTHTNTTNALFCMHFYENGIINKNK